jgi:hypothetical protein
LSVNHICAIAQLLHWRPATLESLLSLGPRRFVRQIGDLLLELAGIVVQGDNRAVVAFGREARLGIRPGGPDRRNADQHGHRNLTEDSRQ